VLPDGAALTRARRSALVPVALTTIAMMAFAANSVLCRLALRAGTIDAVSFTSIRLAAGAAALTLLARGHRSEIGTAAWTRAGFLVLYALPFSLAYVSLDTGTGALLLFGAVQLTMIALGIHRGERPSVVEWVALTGAAGGVTYLVSPGVTAPQPLHAALMFLAGIGWGLYSMAGKGMDAPTAATMAAFQRAALIVLPVALLAVPWLSASWWGIVLATISGAITSGMGYAIWYAALRHLTATRAALVQLSVPVLAATSGVVLLAEHLTLRLVLAGVFILGSIWLGVARRKRAREPAPEAQS
jgi:drug/metabolite transporter (DMT)-like permease